jgi:tetratricopeptide (TPR) repeat protein
MADYHRALEILPESHEIRARISHVHYSFGIELFNRAQFDKAELEFTRAIEFDDSVAAYYTCRGDAARFQEKHQQACTDYLRALELDPRDQDTKDKLCQYSVSLPAASGPVGGSNQQRTINVLSPIRRAEGNTLPAALANRSSSAGASLYAQHSKNQQSKLADARKSYDRKNKLVQDLFLHRPTLPSVKKPLPR